MTQTQAPQRTVTVDEVGTWPVDGFDGHEARILTVDVPAGEHAPVHLHPGSQYNPPRACRPSRGCGEHPQPRLTRRGPQLSVAGPGHSRRSASAISASTWAWVGASASNSTWWSVPVHGNGGR